MRRELQAVKAASPLVQIPNLRRGTELLNELPVLWQHPGVQDDQRQRLLLETFEEVRIWGKDLTAIRPKPQYAAHFAYLAVKGVA